MRIRCHIYMFLFFYERKGHRCSERGEMRGGDWSECLLQVLQTAFRHMMAEIYLFQKRNSFFLKKKWWGENRCSLYKMLIRYARDWSSVARKETQTSRYINKSSFKPAVAERALLVAGGRTESWLNRRKAPARRPRYRDTKVQRYLAWLFEVWPDGDHLQRASAST